MENNQRSAVATVTEAGIRVLYIEGTVRPEFGAVVGRFLAKDPDLEFCAMYQSRPNVFQQRTNMAHPPRAAIPTDQETIDKFDVFILGDIDSSYFRPQQQEMLVKRIRAGAGLLMLGGYHSLGPGGYQGTPLGNVLPVALGNRDVGQLTDSFLPLLTPDGIHHPIFANIDGFFPTPQGPPKTGGLPPLDGCTHVGPARPGATVLATAPAAAAKMPVLVVQPLDHGRTAVFAGDTTRKWQQGPRALNQDSPFLRFWGQTVRWLAGRNANVETQAGIVASADKVYYEPGEPIRLSAIVRDKEGQGASHARVVATVRGPTGRVEEATLSAVTGPGRPLRRRDRAAVGRGARSGGRGPPRRVEPQSGQDRRGSRSSQPGVRETRSRREDVGTHRRRHRRPLRPPGDRRPTDRSARPPSAQNDDYH